MRQKPSFRAIDKTRYNGGEIKMYTYYSVLSDYKKKKIKNSKSRINSNETDMNKFKNDLPE